jgi:hypothetical protein
MMLPRQLSHSTTSMPILVDDYAAESDLDETRLDQPAGQMEQCCASAAGIVSTMS